MIFTRRDLEEKLGLNKEERKLVMEFQKKLPIISDESDFKINARELHSQLEVKTKFNDWITRRISKYKFNENEDFYTVTQKRVSGATTQDITDFHLSLNMAKELCMVENNENGRIARKYFILMEKTVKEMIEWKRIREPEKEGYKLMCSELDKYLQRNFNKQPKFYDYSNEADAINLICLGAKAKDILDYFDTKDKQTREHLTKEYNMYLSYIQELNVMYLRMNIEKSKRYDLIKQGFKVMFPFASFVIANKNKNTAV